MRREITAHEITEDRYDDMLGELPPAARDGKGFLLGEPSIHTSLGNPDFLAFFEIEGKFYECDQFLTIKQYNNISISNVIITNAPA